MSPNPADLPPSGDSSSASSTVTVEGVSKDECPPGLLEPPSETAVISPGPDGDPAQAIPPLYSSFTQWEKRLIVFGAGMSALYSPLTAQIYFPALNLVADSFHVSISKVNLTVTTYMVFQGITPMFIGGLADTAGRRPAYVICFVVYIAANIGIALCDSYAGLLVLRGLQSAGSSSTVALCQAVVADIVTSGERGQYMSLVSLPRYVSFFHSFFLVPPFLRTRAFADMGVSMMNSMVAPSLGPVIGGALAQTLGWRSIFWFLTIIAAIALAALLFVFPETCRKIVGDGSIRPHPAYQTIWQLLKDSRRKRRQAKKRSGDDANALDRVPTGASAHAPPPKLKVVVGNPFVSVALLFEPILGLLLLYSAIVFAGFYAIATAISEQMKAVYLLTEVQIGLVYLPMAGGSVLAALIVGPSLNWNYRRHARRLGMETTRGRQDDLSNFPIERSRIEVGLPLLALSTCVLFAWGWALEYRAHLAVPCVLLFLMGTGMVGFTNAAMVLITDIHPAKAGAATAASNLTRCLLGAASTAAISPLIDAVGSGWAFSILGFLYLLGAPLLLLMMKNGVKWRRQMKEKEDRKQRHIESKNSASAAKA